MKKLKFNPHPDGIKSHYSGQDPYQPKKSDGAFVPIEFKPGDVNEVSDEKATQLLRDFPLNFTEVMDVDPEKQFVDQPVENKMGKAPGKKG
ncbi:MAG: hypothetical protein ONB55_21690 [candidate division KSB1 bacterium]|nr:hypothetical protein [candidate division KSB1 bacterium]